MLFRFYVDETYSRLFIVEAENEDKAYDKVEYAYRHNSLDIVQDGFPSYTNIEYDGEAIESDLDFYERI